MFLEKLRGGYTPMRLATKADIRYFRKRFAQPEQNQLYGLYDGKEISMSYDSSFTGHNSNTLVICADSETARNHYVIPNILQGNHSALILDKDGKILIAYHKRLRELGGNVLTFDLNGPDKDINRLITSLNFKITDFASSRTYLFIKYDETDKAQQKLAGELIIYLWQQLCLCADRCGTQEKPENLHHIQFYLSEFDGLGIPQLLWLAENRGHGMSVSYITPNMSKLESEYSEQKILYVTTEFNMLLFMNIQNQHDYEIASMCCGTYNTDLNGNRRTIEKAFAYAARKNMEINISMQEHHVAPVSEIQKALADNKMLIVPDFYNPIICDKLICASI